MSDFPEFYISRSPEGADTVTPVYYKVTGADPDGHVFWRNPGDERSKEGAFYELFLEEKNGFGVSSVDKGETPWSDS
jgi:hypothetical protein